ncbi:MAG TPA: sugar nucleotide-binding protein [Patescibacteria group bacterium]|nr:sugar nucleotide-binding protein [Patescibacteria group bacterium]
MKEKIIGTGLSGLVGSRIRELLQNSYDFVDFSLDSGVNILEKDNLIRRAEKEKATYLLHLAAFTDVKGAEQQKGDKEGSCYKVNVLGTRNVVAAAMKCNLRLIAISTDYVFEGNDSEKIYTEEDSPNPQNWYGRTKYLAEEEVRSKMKEAVIARIAFPFRTKFDIKKDFIKVILERFESDTMYPMFADQVITPTFIDDIAQAMKFLLEKKKRGVYHVVGSSFVSPHEVAKLVAKVYGFQEDKVTRGRYIDYVQKIGWAPWPQYLKISNGKLQRDSGGCMHTLTEALTAMRKQREELL